MHPFVLVAFMAWSGALWWKEIFDHKSLHIRKANAERNAEYLTWDLEWLRETRVPFKQNAKRGRVCILSSCLSQCLPASLRLTLGYALKVSWSHCSTLLFLSSSLSISPLTAFILYYARWLRLSFTLSWLCFRNHRAKAFLWSQRLNSCSVLLHLSQGICWCVSEDSCCSPQATPSFLFSTLYLSVWCISWVLNSVYDFSLVCLESVMASGAYIQGQWQGHLY